MDLNQNELRCPNCGNDREDLLDKVARDQHRTIYCCVVCSKEFTILAGKK